MNPRPSGSHVMVKSG